VRTQLDDANPDSVRVPTKVSTPGEQSEVRSPSPLVDNEKRPARNELIWRLRPSQWQEVSASGYLKEFKNCRTLNNPNLCQSFNHSILLIMISAKPLWAALYHRVSFVFSLGYNRAGVAPEKSLDRMCWVNAELSNY
jgi:hypothetical protein